MTPHLGIAACLLGARVRHDGGAARAPSRLQALRRFATFCAVCPEAEAGLGVPREAVRLVRTDDGIRVVGSRTGEDHTVLLTSWGRTRLDRLDVIDGYVAKKGSPSCGAERVRVHPDGGGPPRSDGVGVFVSMLRRSRPEVPVEEEGRLQDGDLAEAFLSAVFCRARFRAAVPAERDPGALVRFHTTEKLLVMAHSPDHYRRLGRLVARAGSDDWPTVRSRYLRTLTGAFARATSRGRRVNALQHVAGMLPGLSPAQRRSVATEIRSYAAGLVPVAVPLAVLNHHVRADGAPEWLVDQTFLDPFPAELLVRTGV